MSVPSSRLTASDLLTRPERIAELEDADVARLLVHVTSVASVLAARLQMNPTAKVEDDRLLDVAEASQMLGRSPDWLYRHARTLPFTRRLNGMLKFSRQGLQKYLDRLPRA